ncbi:MAG: PilZ domain-containing protein [Pseudomonadota bacterium]|nr:PilZ domain-containing protein [Pseudomonadota bacterium]
MDANEKRLHPRKDVFSAAMLVLYDEGYLSEVWDISQGGARLGKPKKWPSSFPEIIRVFFMLDQDTVISLEARIARSDDDHVGLQFTEGQEQRVQQLMYEARFLESETT